MGRSFSQGLTLVCSWSNKIFSALFPASIDSKGGGRVNIGHSVTAHLQQWRGARLPPLSWDYQAWVARALSKGTRLSHRPARDPSADYPIKGWLRVRPTGSEEHWLYFDKTSLRTSFHRKRRRAYLGRLSHPIMSLIYLHPTVQTRPITCRPFI
jgi:hypothetical protein